MFANYGLVHRLNLEFTFPEIVAMVIAAFVTDQIVGNGGSEWLEGVRLLALYVILGVLFYLSARSSVGWVCDPPRSINHFISARGIARAHT